jgi:diacylglycerol diphosphate phosphatase/phosphatidate phosphatase
MITVWNVAYSVVLPLCIFVLWAALFRPGVHKTNVTILGLAISIMLATFLTDVVKNSVGRPRPDLIARCKPKKSTPQHALVTIDVCTETEHHTLHDGWRSFPSGHSSLAFSGLGYLALFFAGQMHVFRPRTDLARVLLALAPVVGAALIAISRLEDYRHDVFDVTVGSLLGMLVAYFSYRRYYPSLKSDRCDMPYPSRADLANSGYGKVKDEEARMESSGSFSVDDMEDEAEHVPLKETSRDRNRGRLASSSGE